jgi:hypothetical protein
MMDAFKKGLVKFPDEPSEEMHVFPAPVKKKPVIERPKEDPEHPVTLAEHCRRIASLGGKVRSERKTAAARQNASKSRPKSSELNKLRRAAQGQK